MIYIDIKKIPPNNNDAEQSVLGAILLDNSIMPELSTIIRPDDFYHPDNKILYEAFLELEEKKIPIDIISVSNVLESKDKLKQIGGLKYLSNIAMLVPTSANAVHYANIVKEKSIRRQVIKYAQESITKAYSCEYESPLDVKSDALEIMNKVEINDFGAVETIKSVTERIKNNIDKKIAQPKDEEERLFTGIADYDFWLDGLHEQEFTIIGARPSVGKSAFALQIAQHLAKNGVHVLFDTLEMSDEQLVMRLASSHSQINGQKLRKPKFMNKDDYSAFVNTCNYIGKLPLYIEYLRNIEDLRARCRALKIKGKLDVVMVDYLQLMSTYKQVQNRTGELGHVSRNLKALSREFEIPVIALAQLTRDTEKQNRKPRLSDLREAGDMEQDADNVIFIHNPNDDSTEEIQDREIIIGKQRNGSTGSFNMLLEGKTFRFFSIDKNNFK